jgi:hypothetical protein
VDILNSYPHTVLFPGHDRFKCGTCGHWISTSREIDRLKESLDKECQKTKRRSAKKIEDLRLLIEQEKRKWTQCLPVDNHL